MTSLSYRQGAVRMVPESVLDEYRKRAETELRDPGISRWAGLLIVPATGCMVILPA